MYPDTQEGLIIELCNLNGDGEGQTRRARQMGGHLATGSLHLIVLLLLTTGAAANAESLVVALGKENFRREVVNYYDSQANLVSHVR